MTTPTPATEKTATYYVRDGQLHSKGGTCDCKMPCTEVVKLDYVAALVEALEDAIVFVKANHDGSRSHQRRLEAMEAALACASVPGETT
jgi:hypothetical protein